MNHMIEQLAKDYPLLYLDPDTDTQETYRRVVLEGREPESKSLAHYQGDPMDREETADTPAGSVRVITLGNRRDFELTMRGFMAARSGPQKTVPGSQGAAMLTVFNWPRIRAHLSRFPEEERSAEFQRFTSVRENYTDMLVVLSRGPYSHVEASVLGVGESEWLERSDTIRRFHELTHVICRRKNPGDIDPVRDELVADAVGLYAAYGCFDPALEQQFLGIEDGRYTLGRLGNYTDRPEELTERVCAALDRIRKITDGYSGEPFALIPSLMEAAKIEFLER